MSSHRIETVERLHEYLYAALQLEHATIPPYLTALYSLHPGTNSDAAHVIRVVAVEEMLHLTLAANLLNAVGGTVDLQGELVTYTPHPSSECGAVGGFDYTVSDSHGGTDTGHVTMTVVCPG